MVIRLILFVLVIISSVQHILAEDIDPSLLRKFMDGVAENTTLIDKFSVKARIVTTVERRAESELAQQEVTAAGYSPNKPEIEEISTVAIHGPLGLKASTGHGKNTSVEFVTARNDKYAFRIRRSPANTKYSIEFLQELGGDSDLDSLIKDADLEARAFFIIPWMVFRVPISQLVKSPDFRVRKISRVDSNGIEAVRIDFDHLTDDPNRKMERLSDAYLVCDPANGWGLREYCATLHHGGIVQHIIEFGAQIDSVPITSKFTSVYSVPKSTSVVRHTVMAAEEVSEDVSDDEFYLSHYGLPEPNFERSFFGRWVWLLGSGIACLIAARFLIKRRAANLKT